MVAFLSISAVVTLLFFAFYQMYRNSRASGAVDAKSVIAPRLFCALAIMFSCGMMCRDVHPFCLLSDSVAAVVSASPLILSMRPDKRLPFHIDYVCVIIPLMSVYYILCAIGALGLLAPEFFIVSSVLMAASLPCLFICFIWEKIRDVKSLMKSGNVWSFLTLCVDFIYVLSPLLVMSLIYPVYVMFPKIADPFVYIAVMLLLLEVVAVAIRVSYDSAFVVMHEHERLIVESMKITRMDAPAASDIKGEEQYKELYERIVLHFEMSKPYLDGDLTINDLVKVVYSNKVYISKAICHYTGRNFRQFVNYYRVMYSMDLFRNHPEMKVSDLADKSGFNNSVSYTMAFRLFMNETPSDWCRKERSKILKPKK